MFIDQLSVPTTCAPVERDVSDNASGWLVYVSLRWIEKNPFGSRPRSKNIESLPDGELIRNILPEKNTKSDLCTTDYAVFQS